MFNRIVAISIIICFVIFSGVFGEEFTKEDADYFRLLANEKCDQACIARTTCDNTKDEVFGESGYGGLSCHN